MRYENLLTRSFGILRRKPWLCLLALLAGDTSNSGGGGGGGNIQARSAAPASASAPDLAWIPQWLADRGGLIIEIALVVLVVALVWFLVSCVASGALVGGVARIDAGERMTFGAAWRIGTAAFRRVLAFKLLLIAAILLPALLLAIPLLVGGLGAGRGLLLGLLLDLPLFIAYLYWTAFLRWFSELALRACVLEELGARSAVVAAWSLIKRRFHRVALTTVVFIGVGFGLGILTSIVFAFVEAPFLASVLTAVGQGHWSDLPGIVLLGTAILIPVSLAVSSAVGAYFATAWTLAYRRFDVEGEVAAPAPLAG